MKDFYPVAQLQHEKLLKDIEKENIPEHLQKAIASLLGNYRAIIKDLPTQKVTAYNYKGEVGILIGEPDNPDMYNTFTVTTISENEMSEIMDTSTTKYKQKAIQILKDGGH